MVLIGINPEQGAKRRVEACEKAFCFLAGGYERKRSFRE